MEKVVVTLVGRGRLAQELERDLSSPRIARVIRWEDRDAFGGCRSVVVHAGSGRELEDVVRFCTVTGTLLLDLATGENRYPADLAIPVVRCPNVNMQMLCFMAMVKQSSSYFRGQDIRITESHQATKKTKPGTAIAIAEALGVPEAEIHSERAPRIQQEQLGIPAAFVDRHAYHDITICVPDVEIRLQTRVFGKSAYARGLARVIDLVSGRTLAPGLHDIVDLVIGAVFSDSDSEVSQP